MNSIDKKRLEEINDEMETLKAAMEAAEEKGDWKKYEELQKRYAQFLNMQLSIGSNSKDKAENKIGIGRLIVDLLGVLVSAGLGFFAIFGAIGADKNDVIVNNRSWNIAMDMFTKKRK